MTARTYPYKAWVLQPTFKPIEVELQRHYSQGLWDQTASGKLYHVRDLFPTQQEAIEHGWKEIERMQEALDKKAEGLRKKRSALNTATQLSKGK
jgi:hypothetical protein